MRVRFSFTTDAALALVRLAQGNGLAPSSRLLELEVDAKPSRATNDWLVDVEDALRLAQSNVRARFDGGAFISIDPKAQMVKWEHEVAALNAQAICQELATRSFVLGVGRVRYKSWNSAQVERFSFGKGHDDHGFACFFQGEGHKRLVSRRWLDYGPWRVLLGENDTTMVQFHDLEADGDTALAQAMPGHERMGMSYTGGFLWPTMTFRILKSWLYDRAAKKVTVLINRREIEPGELLEAATMRAFQRLGPDQPIERVAYVFVHPDEAQQHLHDLWLRELECWTFTPKGQEIRLDLDYQPPPPVKPAWVREVEEREAQ